MSHNAKRLLKKLLDPGSDPPQSCHLFFCDIVSTS